MIEDDLQTWLKTAIYTARYSAEEALKVWPPDDEIAGEVESIVAGAFIHRNNPQVVLAICDAHTRILKRHTPRIGVEGPHEGDVICGCSDGADEFTAVPWPCDDIRAIASCYQHEDGYREEWRP